jgi:hypothetical protein
LGFLRRVENHVEVAATKGQRDAKAARVRSSSTCWRSMPGRGGTAVCPMRLAVEEPQHVGRALAEQGGDGIKPADRVGLHREGRPSFLKKRSKKLLDFRSRVVLEASVTMVDAVAKALPERLARERAGLGTSG